MTAGPRRNARANARLGAHARAHIERLLADVNLPLRNQSRNRRPPGDAFAPLGAVHGHRVRPLGVEHFGQTGSIGDIYRHYGIDIGAIVAAAQGLAPERPIRHLRALS